MNNYKNTFRNVTVAGLITLSASAVYACPVYACPVTNRAANFPASFATTDTSSIAYSLSRTGTFTVTRTLAEDVPATAVACTTTLEGRYSRKASFSAVTTLGSRSSTAKVVKFTAKRLPSVKVERFNGGTIQPSLHLQAVTECVDSLGSVVLADTSPVVARYADCGFTSTRVSMATFVSTLVRKLSR